MAYRQKNMTITPLPDSFKKRFKELIDISKYWTVERDKEKMVSFKSQADPLIAALDPFCKPGIVGYTGSLADLWYDTRHPDYNYVFNEDYAQFYACNGFLESLLLVDHYMRTDEKQDDYDDADALTVRNSPFFERKHQYKTMESVIFVLMPFAEPWSNRIWKDHIQKYVKECGPNLRCLRADDLFGQDVMVETFRHLVECKMIIADITGRNPNVFYEVGMCHAMGKNVILLTQNVRDVPFDLLRFRHCIYEDNSDGYLKMRFFIQNAVKELLRQ